MREYKFYRVKTDGHVGGPACVRKLPNDQAALKEARAAVADGNIEIWQGTRMVASIVADETRQTPAPTQPGADRHK